MRVPIYPVTVLDSLTYSPPVVMKQLSGLRYHAPCMARDHQFFIRRHYPCGNPTCRRADARAVFRIRGRIERHAEPGCIDTHALADGDCALAYAAGEHQRIETAEGCGQ